MPGGKVLEGGGGSTADVQALYLGSERGCRQLTCRQFDFLTRVTPSLGAVTPGDCALTLDWCALSPAGCSLTPAG